MDKTLISQGHTSTPNKKDDQWHRLASVVRSSQKTFVPSSPLVQLHTGTSSILRCRTKLAFKDGTSSVGLHDEIHGSACNGGHRGTVHVGTPDTKAMVAAYSSQTTPSKIRSLAIVKQEVKSMTSSYQRRKRTESLYPRVPKHLRPEKAQHNGNSMPLTNPYLLKFLRTFIVLVALVWICINYHSHYRATSRRILSIDDVKLLRSNLHHRVYGQHIAVKSIPSAMDKLLETQIQGHSFPEDHQPGGAKLTVISLHGWTGVGKTFVTQLLVDSLNPDNFLQFIIPLHFPHIRHDVRYKSRIQHDIVTNISSSSLNLIVFDEMDKASPGVLDGIRSTIILLREENSFKNSTVIIVFVSNTLGRSINTRLFNLLSQGRPRRDIVAADFHDIFFQDGSHGIAPWYTVFTDYDLIDNFIPFLPLDKSHVGQCIEHSLDRKGAAVTHDLVSAILAELSLFRPLGSAEQYSQTGCKRVAEKVDLCLNHISKQKLCNT